MLARVRPGFRGGWLKSPHCPLALPCLLATNSSLTYIMITGAIIAVVFLVLGFVAFTYLQRGQM